ncbi:MAG: polysaccharide deacetylase family protein [Cyclobacteriaceae bacterium]|nr:polysaccharide deacetylase family protein [Cyclobacteriaceae bacterium]MDH4296334.1 polysaccharide deacetylase family protein [Cyclobacteriaceae bacterium]MDH5248694.1 polysaccharide deacetylase family protein [Cyclobacteriaceae bacterium]
MVHRTPFLLPLLYPSLTWRMPSTDKSLYLTFDDGPVPGPTEFVLETLLKYNAKATFFCIGDNILKHPKIFEKVVDQGHAIGNHTFNHLNGWKTDTDYYINNMWQCNNEIQLQLQNTGRSRNTLLFRPPFGRITRSQIRALHAFKIIMWDVLSVDYLHSLSADRCLRNTIGATRSGSIIVFHDSHKAEKNLTMALPGFIEHFSSLGFEFKAISG